MNDYNLFIDEQVAYQELRSVPERTERLVWTPLSRRFTHWTFEGLCKCDHRGNIVPGSRRRNPFIVGVQP